MTSVYARRAVRGAAAIALALMGWRSAAAQEAAAFPYGAPAARDTRAGSGCPAGYLCGQNWSADDWLYSDLGFSNSGLTGRVTSEQFPPPGEPSLTQAISLVTWYGTTVDGAFQICTKPLSFRIEFYNDDGTGKPDCAHVSCDLVNRRILL